MRFSFGSRKPSPEEYLNRLDQQAIQVLESMNEVLEQNKMPRIKFENNQFILSDLYKAYNKHQALCDDRRVQEAIYTLNILQDRFAEDYPHYISNYKQRGNRSDENEKRANPTQNPRYAVPSTKNPWGLSIMSMVAIAATVVGIGGGMYQYSQNQALQKQFCNGLETQGGVLEELVRQGGSKGSEKVAALTNEIRGNLGIPLERANEAFSEGGHIALSELTRQAIYGQGCRS